MVKRNPTKAAPAEDLAALVTTRLNEIKRLLGKLHDEAQVLAGQADWPSVGSLGRLAEGLAELAGERG
jgi:hypothetical protein